MDESPTLDKLLRRAGDSDLLLAHDSTVIIMPQYVYILNSQEEKTVEFTWILNIDVAYNDFAHAFIVERLY